MNQPPRRRSPASRWIALGALLALLAGLSVAVVQWMPRRGGNGAAPAAEPSLAPEGDPADSAQKSRWVEEVPGVDLEGLDPGRRRAFLVLANERRCTCGCGYTLAACRVYDATCDESGPKVQALLDSLRAAPPE